MTSTILVLNVVSIVSHAAAGFDYCRITGCAPGDHTLCKYPANQPDCKGRAGLSAEQRKEILRLHNELRQKVAQGKQVGDGRVAQPPAANMMKMSWNNEAEDIAQRWSERCKVSHDSCRRMKDGTAAGQNAAGLGLIVKPPNRTAVVADAFNMWYSEVDEMDPGQVAQFTSTRSAHYTAIVSSVSKQVGCGYMESEATATLICNYVPAGNVLGTPLYQKGKGCSACPKGSRCSLRYPGLCTDEKNEYDDIPQRDKVSATIPSSVLWFVTLLCVML